VLSGRKREKAPRETPPKGNFFVFSHGDLSPRHTKVRDIPCVAFSATVCLIFAWRGERSPCENPPKSPFGGISRGDLSRFRPENTLKKHGTYKCVVFLAGYRVATFRPARQRYDKQEAKRRRMKCVVLSRGGAKGRKIVQLYFCHSSHDSASK